MYRLKELSKGYLLQRRILCWWVNTNTIYSSINDGMDAMEMLTNGADAIQYHYLGGE